MKIIDIEVIVLRQKELQIIGDGSQDTAVIKVYTDEGIVGLGEVDSSPYVVKAIVEAQPSHSACFGLRDLLIGEDPFEIERLWNKMYEKSIYYGRRSVAIHAMSGIDIALWDIMGKALNLPIYKLLGGKYRDKIDAYCSVLMPGSEEEIKGLVERHMGKGYKGMKLGWGALGQSIENDVRLAKCARECLGNDKKLMLDIGMMWKDVKTAKQTCNEFEKLNVYWVEEPFSPDDLGAYQFLRNNTSLRIAGGEEVTTVYEFNELLENNCVDVLQPDLSRCGGLTIAKKISDLANMHLVPIVPHAFKSGILMAATLQFIASMKNADFLEYCEQETILSTHLIHEHFIPDENGEIIIPDLPGLGIELNEDVVSDYRV